MLRMKHLKIFLIVFMMCLFSGCYYYHYSGEILDDQSFHMKFYFAKHDVDYDYYHSAGEEYFQSFIDKGFSYHLEEAEVETEEGYRSTYDVLEKTVSNIKDLCSDDENVVSNIGFFSDEEFANFSDPVFYCESKEFNKTVYHANFYFKYRVYNNIGENTGWLDPADSEPGKNDYDLIVNFSDLVYCFNVGNGEFLSQDATHVFDDGKSACWVFDLVNENYLHFTFSLNNGPIIEYQKDDVSIDTEHADMGEVVQFRVANP